MSESCTLIWHGQTKHVLGMTTQSSTSEKNVVPPKEVLVRGWKGDKRLDFRVSSASTDNPDQLMATFIENSSELLTKWGSYRIADGHTVLIEKKLTSATLDSKNLTVTFKSNGDGTEAVAQSKVWCQIQPIFNDTPAITKLGTVPTDQSKDFSFTLDELPNAKYRVLILAEDRQPFFEYFEI